MESRVVADAKRLRMTRLLTAIVIAASLTAPSLAKASGRAPQARREAIAPAWDGTPPLVAAALHDLGRGNFTGKPGPWCAFAVSAWLERIGLRPLSSGMASSALGYGPHVAPRPGVLAVSARHVGIVVAVDGARVQIASGNWSHRVALAWMPARVFAAFVQIEDRA